MGMDPISWAVLGAAAISAGATGYAGYKQSQAQREAAKKAEESTRTQAQLAAERAPEQASATTSDSVIKREEGIKGLRSQLLANRNKVTPTDGDKTLLGQ